MAGWYERLPIHGKLVAMALAVTTAVSVLAVTGTVLVDIWRYRTTAADDTQALASVIAENVAAAVVFQDPEEAATILSAAAVRPTIRRACLYLPDQTIFAGYARPGESCPAQPDRSYTWFGVSGAAPITRNDRVLGMIHVDRELPELWTSVAVTATTGLVMILLGGLVAVPIANRLHRGISEPIAQLAGAVRTMRPEGSAADLPPIETDVSEIGDLIRAFSGLLERVSRSNVEREDLLRREREASRLKDEFVAAVSHELRTPLNAIVGWVQILANTSPSPEVMTKAIESIGRNARAQTRVIEDIVDVSRIVTGKLTVRFTPVDLRDVIESSVDLCRAAAHAKSITVTMAVPEHPCLVSGDRDRLQQVLGNLLSNAVKFTLSGGAVHVELRQAPGAYEIAVTDNGIGIPANFVPFVFDRFRQADGSMTRQQGGLGLGLAIVKELISLHHGVVTAESDGPDRGSTFRVRLPALIDAPIAVPSGSAQTPFLSGALTGVRVLAVDDNLDALEVLTEALRRAGAEVRTASSGHAALELAVQDRPDVLLCDLAMPDLDGFEVLRRLQRSFGAVDRMFPAIAISAHAGDEHRASSLKAGFSEHVAKPYQVERLVEVVRRFASLAADNAGSGLLKR